MHYHPYHLVEKSPWPLTASLAALSLTSGLIQLMYSHSSFLMTTGVTLMALTCYQWWRDVSREASLQGLHSLQVTKSMKLGMILFILSEILFFSGFFWAYFHSSLSPTVQLGALWPPSLLIPFNPFQIPLLNTAILLSSGITVTWAHHSLIENHNLQTTLSLAMTVFLGVYFTALQAFEYTYAPFSISDSVYGSTFFMATGFHGLHVMIGTLFLFITLIRHSLKHFSSLHHFGFEAAAWYWHFVDIVWLFLYISIYWWGK